MPYLVALPNACVLCFQLKLCFVRDYLRLWLHLRNAVFPWYWLETGVSVKPTVYYNVISRYHYLGT